MAGRPSKLTNRQWGDIGRRLAKGETAADLSREFKIGKARISERFAGKAENIKALATQLVAVETAIERLPVSEQSSVMAFADDLKHIARSASAGGRAGMNGAANLMARFERQVANLPDDAGMDDLRPIAALAETAQKGASLGLALMNANKATVEAANEPVEPKKITFEIIRPQAVNVKSANSLPQAEETPELT